MLSTFEGDVPVQFVSILAGLVLLGIILFDVFASVVVPRPVRGAFVRSGYVRRHTWRAWRAMCLGIQSPAHREAYLGMYAPMVMVLLLCIWVFGLILGFGLIFFGLRDGLRPVPPGFGAALYYAGTSLLTIGYGDIVATAGLTRFFSICAATAGLATVAVVVTFLFSSFSSFQRREAFVVMLDARSGAPASGVSLLETHAALGLIHDLQRLFEVSQTWCAEVLDTHLAYPILCYFRSSHADVSWIASLGALLDSATLVVSTIEDVPTGQATLLHSVGSHLAHDLAKYFGLMGEDVVLVELAEFRAARGRLEAAGYRLGDEVQGWESFQRLRSEYACPELRAYCRGIALERKREYADEAYWGKPVPSIGPASARLLIMGLAPAAHGGNRTGRMFTGDGSALFLARALYRAGFATQSTSVRRGDGFELIDAFMSAALRCAPPANRPTRGQLHKCAVHLRAELDVLRRIRVVVALGKIGFDNIYARLRERGYVAASRPIFGHARELRLSAADRPDLILVCSYHPSRQNTNTGRLTQAMLDRVFLRARRLISKV
jgi:uracil-DNA glycosylase family 4